MEHNIPNMIDVDQGEWPEKIRQFLPDYMPMGQSGMGEMFEMSHHMQRPANFLPLGSPGPFGMIEMSGMFTILKVREEVSDSIDPGWYTGPSETEMTPEPGDEENESPPVEMPQEHVHHEHVHKAHTGLSVGDFHPFLVHFPIALFFTVFVFDLIALGGRGRAVYPAAHWMAIAAAALAIPTVVTGLYAMDLGHADHPDVLIHRNWALLTLSYSLGHAVFRAYCIRANRAIPIYIFVLVSLVNVALISITAEYGSVVTREKGLWKTADTKAENVVTYGYTIKEQIAKFLQECYTRRSR